MAVNRNIFLWMTNLIINEFYSQKYKTNQVLLEKIPNHIVHIITFIIIMWQFPITLYGFIETWFERIWFYNIKFYKV